MNRTTGRKLLFLVVQLAVIVVCGWCPIDKTRNGFHIPLQRRQSCPTSLYDPRQQRRRQRRKDVIAVWETVPTRSNQKDDMTATDDCGYFIRTCMIGDVGRMATILADGFFKYRTNFLAYQWERLVTYLSLDSTFPKENEVHEMFVACDSRTGVVVGCVELDGRPEEIAKRGSVEAMEDDCDIKRAIINNPYMCNLAVDESYRHLGIASALVRECETLVQEWHVTSNGTIPKRISLRVRQSTNGAIQLYNKLGYQSYEHRPSSNGDTIIAMSKTLP